MGGRGAFGLINLYLSWIILRWPETKILMTNILVKFKQRFCLVDAHSFERRREITLQFQKLKGINVYLPMHKCLSVVI